MIWKTHVQNILVWHEWFAWYPVCLSTNITGNKKWIWLERVMRKDIHKHSDYNTWRYELIKEKNETSVSK